MKIRDIVIRLLFGTREQWEERAERLRCKKGWFVGRTDTWSYDMTGGYVHSAYPPGRGDGVRFHGTPVTALRKAVLYAERMNHVGLKDQRG